MDISRRHSGDVCIVDVTGRLTLEHGGQLKHAVNSALGEGCAKIILNLERVTHLDSSGLGETVACFATAQKGHARIALVTQGKGKDLLVMTKLWTVFDCVERVDDALTMLSAESAVTS